MHFKTTPNSNDTSNIQTKRGIFQGDSLSPLLFCITLISLSKELNRTKTGYKVRGNEKAINHLLFMDDLKLIAKNESELGQQILIVKKFSDDIRMEFGLDKCAKVMLKKGRYAQSENLQVGLDKHIQQLEQG